MTHQARETALLKILRDAGLNNEAGEPMVDFVNQDRDALDFTSVSRSRLESMLLAAYDAGRYSR